MHKGVAISYKHLGTIKGSFRPHNFLENCGRYSIHAVFPSDGMCVLEFLCLYSKLLCQGPYKFDHQVSPSVQAVET